MRKLFCRAGQSTLEYVIVLTAIVAAILFAATQFIKPGVNRIYSETGKKLNDSGTIITNKVGISLSGLAGTTGGGTTGGTSGGSGGVGV